MSNETVALSDAWPQKLALAAVALSWKMQYTPSESGEVALQEEDRSLIFNGGIQQLEDCKPPLFEWLKGQAHLYIEPWLQKLSKACELPYKKLAFRGQKTLWGSCSEGANINLNYYLLFLPARLVRYVLVHELCHTMHLDHSKEFWALVERHEPNYRRLKTELKKANQYIPEWILQ